MRGGFEAKAAAVGLGEIDDDREAESGAGLGLVEPQAALAELLRCSSLRPGPSSSIWTKRRFSCGRSGEGPVETVR